MAANGFPFGEEPSHQTEVIEILDDPDGGPSGQEDFGEEPPGLGRPGFGKLRSSIGYALQAVASDRTIGPGSGDGQS